MKDHFWPLASITSLYRSLTSELRFLASTVRLPLETEAETIWVTEVKLLHAVRRNYRLFHVDSLGAQVGVHSINVGSSEQKPCVAVRGDAARVDG
jgi:hypothetical protein